MRRRSFTHALISAALVRWVVKPFAAVAKSPDGDVRVEDYAIGDDVDGIVIRGNWRAHVATGEPGLKIFATRATLGEVSITRNDTTLTVASAAPESSPDLEIRATLARLRGLATSGAVHLTIDDPGGAPLFLDLAGTGTARAVGSVPLLRVTTSGSVSADLVALTATTVRVHARQASRLAVRARKHMTVVALDTARVSFGGSADVKLTTKGNATLTRL